MFVRTSGTWVFIETRSCLISMAKVGSSFIPQNSHFTIVRNLVRRFYPLSEILSESVL